jgi:tight adherence protein B
MSLVTWPALGLLIAGWPGLLITLLVLAGARARKARVRPIIPTRPILFVLLVESRSGASALGALQAAATSFPGVAELTRASRLATVSGIAASVSDTDGPVRTIMYQLARAQRSGAPLADTIRSMIEADIAAERARRIARARTMPTRLMIPVTTLVLPGLVLLFYAPALLRMFDEISGPLG